VTGAVAAVLVGLAVAAWPAGAQTLNPPVAVYDGKASGAIVIANPSIFRMNFVLDPMSFIMASNGDISFGPLDTGRIRLRLSSMSGRIPARQSIRLFYEASADSLPSWFAVVATFSRGAPATGLAVRLQMPHMVYLMQRGQPTRSELSLDAVTFDSATSTLRARLENRSAKLTRLESFGVEWAGPVILIDAGPVFPNSVRTFTYVWNRPGRPTGVIASFPDFSIATPVTNATVTAAPPHKR
jgi:hypothetical protein